MRAAAFIAFRPGSWRWSGASIVTGSPTTESLPADPRDPGRRIHRAGDLARVGVDGLVYFLGRADSQIKSRGYRIELREIETALHSLDGIREGAIVAVDAGGFEGKTICCAYVPRHHDLLPRDLRSRLAGLLPAYMLPARWQAMPVLPRNANGKVDRRALRESFEQSAGRRETTAGSRAS